MLTSKKIDYTFEFIDPNKDGSIEKTLLHICIERLLSDGIANTDCMPYDQYYIADMVTERKERSCIAH